MLKMNNFDRVFDLVSDLLLEIVTIMEQIKRKI